MKKILLILLVALGSLFANPAHASSCNAPIWQAQLANLADSVKSDWSLRGFKAARLARDWANKTLFTEDDYRTVVDLDAKHDAVFMLAATVRHIVDTHDGKLCTSNLCIPEVERRDSLKPEEYTS